MTVPPAAADDFDAGGWRPPTDDDARRPADLLAVSLDGFDGPLDLLLALARTQKVDLRRLSMLALADQYLEHITRARDLRLEIAGDYLVMAAWLAYLKSRLLMPAPPAAPDVPTAEALAARLRFRLLRLEAMRAAATRLMVQPRLGVDFFPRGMPERGKTHRTRSVKATLYDLLKAYADQRTRTLAKHSHVVKRREVWSIKDARAYLDRVMGASAPGEWVQLDLFLDQVLPTRHLSRTALAASFGASLEMARDGLVELQQEGPFAPIYIRKR